MRDIRVATIQFEAEDRNKAANLARIQTLAREAVARGAEFVSFHECCIPGYTFLMGLTRPELEAIAEPVPDGPATASLLGLSRDLGVPIGAGLIEKDGNKLHNTWFVVSPDGFVAKHRKLHPFVNPHLSAGDSYTVFDLLGCRWGILICYDNNLPENVRITALMGAEIILMPHVTCGTQSPMPGRGKIAREVWEQRVTDPVRCRQEFRGPKGREWLLRWLPARVYENGVYGVFSNPVGIDHDTVKPGLAMVLDPYGEILAEATELGDEVVVAQLTAVKLDTASGQRYLRARRPELYSKLVEARPEDDEAVVLPGWTLERPPDCET